MPERPRTQSTAETISLLGELASLMDPDLDARATYELVADRYDQFRALWIRWLGGEAEQAMLDDLAATLSPGARVLDAGTGTGAMARHIARIEPASELVLLDSSPAMLDHADDLDAERVIGSVLDLPFPDDHFDIVTSAWVIETVPDPIGAVREYLRVLNPGGHIFFTFCSLPQGWFSRAGSAILRGAIRRGFAGEFLPEDRTPWHDCDHSHRVRFRGGLATEIALRKCCDVGDPILPRHSIGDSRAADRKRGR